MGNACFHIYLFVFFFQAEDGIRDSSVTGVQTCALPIYFVAPDGKESLDERMEVSSKGVRMLTDAYPGRPLPHPIWEIKSAPDADATWANRRSEERRVGKECRGRRST